MRFTEVLAAIIALLHWGAFDCTIGAIHTAISLPGVNDIPAVFALVKVLAGISGHFFLFLVLANRTGYNALGYR
jgi:hypothetical protein